MHPNGVPASDAVASSVPIVMSAPLSSSWSGWNGAVKSPPSASILASVHRAGIRSPVKSRCVTGSTVGAAIVGGAGSAVADAVTAATTFGGPFEHPSCRGDEDQQERDRCAADRRHALHARSVREHARASP